MKLHSISPSTIWITGITASGKTTLGQSLYERLVEKGVIPLEFLDGDELRKHLFSKTYSHSMEDRLILLKKIVKLAKEKNKRGITVIVSTVSHKKAMREYARSQISQFMEVYLDCSLKVCVDRDHKGLYERAYSGEYDLFPGITEPYEPSDAPPHLTLYTEKTPFSECANILFRKVTLFLGMES